jgi:hypothetical protein
MLKAVSELLQGSVVLKNPLKQWSAWFDPAYRFAPLRVLAVGVEKYFFRIQSALVYFRIS